MTTLDMTLPADAQLALNLIVQAGGRPMLAGGCVRDALLAPGTVPADIDIEVYGLSTLDRVATALAARGFSAGEAGASFSVLKARTLQCELDIALPRRDSKAGPGHRGFEVRADPGLDMAQACARRELTVNAMLADPWTGEVLDFHGGQDDLARGVLRHVSPAFTEDPLRVLRAVRFASRLGFALDAGTAMLCRQMAATFPELAAERVYGELSKIARQGTRISQGLAVLEDTGWEIWFPELAAMRGVPQEPEWHPEGDVWTHAGLAADAAARLADEAGFHADAREAAVLAALLHDCGKVTHTFVLGGRLTSHGHAAAGVKPALAFLRAAGFPRHVAEEVAPLVREHMNCATVPSKPAVRRLARRLAPSGLSMLALVIAADCKGRGDPDAEHALAGAWLEMSRDLAVSAAPAKGILTGHDLIKAGMTPGPAFKPVLAAALAAQDDGAFSDEAGAVEWLTREGARL